MHQTTMSALNVSSGLHLATRAVINEVIFTRSEGERMSKALMLGGGAPRRRPLHVKLDVDLAEYLRPR